MPILYQFTFSKTNLKISTNFFDYFHKMPRKHNNKTKNSQSCVFKVTKNNLFTLTGLAINANKDTTQLNVTSYLQSNETTNFLFDNSLLPPFEDINKLLHMMVEKTSTKIY